MFPGRLALFVGALCMPVFLAYPCLAADRPSIVEAPGDLTDGTGGWSNRVDFAWGVAVTSNYISSGETQSNDRPAVQAYAELSAGIVYAGAWISSIEIEPDNAELDLYMGLRPTFGPVDLDLNYTRYINDKTGDCCGDFNAKASLKASDFLTLSGKFTYDPQSHDRSATFGTAIALNDSLEFSAELEQDLLSHDNNWNAGLKWQASDTISFDLRYHDSELYDERYVFTLAYDFSTAD